MGVDAVFFSPDVHADRKIKNTTTKYFFISQPQRSTQLSNNFKKPVSTPLAENGSAGTTIIHSVAMQYRDTISAPSHS
ncbi:MAG: hypothetical protein ACM3Y8_10070, partial [Byssovorax cruenta]